MLWTLSSLSIPSPGVIVESCTLGIPLRDSSKNSLHIWKVCSIHGNQSACLSSSFQFICFYLLFLFLFSALPFLFCLSLRFSSLTLIRLLCPPLSYPPLQQVQCIEATWWERELYNTIKFTHRDGQVQVSGGPQPTKSRSRQCKGTYSENRANKDVPPPRRSKLKRDRWEKESKKERLSTSCVRLVYVLSTSWVRLEYVLCTLVCASITQAFERTHRPLRWPIWPARVKTLHQSTVMICHVIAK